MPYIGNSPGTGTRNRFIYTATASQTTFSGADDNGKTLKYADSDYVDVYLNGICLVPVTDYTSTSKTSIVLTQAASLNDTLEVVAYDIATISDTVSKADGGTFEDAVTVSGKLTVQNQVQAVDITNSTGNLNMNFTPNDSTGIAQVNFGPSTDKDKARIRYEVANDDLKLITNNTDRITINTSGTVGIGTTSPSDSTSTYKNLQIGLGGIVTGRTDDTPLHLNSNLVYDGSNFDYIANTTASQIILDTNIKFSNAPSGTAGTAATLTERMRIDSNGTVLVGATSSLTSSSTLELHGSGNYFIQRNTGATAGQYWRHEVDTNNTLYILDNGSTGVYIPDGSTSWSSLSDETLKENITDVGDVLDKVKNYRTSRFNWVGGQEDDTRIGFIAQDWETDFPEVVSQGKDDKLGLNYTETIPVLLKAIQELNAKVETLETQNTTQATQIDDLITRVEALEAG